MAPISDSGPGMTRRGLLKSGLVLGAAAAGGVSVSSCATERFPISPGPDFADLARRLEGSVILPRDRGYDAARVLFNPAYDYVRPIAVVRAAGVEDVQVTIEFARGQDIELVTRSGGHSFAGFSTGPGIVLDVSALNRVEADPAGRRATIGPGAKLIDVVSALEPTGRTVPSGWCPTVGVSGLTLGGGIGKLTRLYGLTCDRLRGLEMVTAEGEVLRADEETNPDLFWASRGGGGNFGLVTSLEFELVPVDFPFTRFGWSWPWDRRNEVFAAWQAWMIEAPRGASSTITFSTPGPDANGLTVAVEGSFGGPTDEAEAFVAELEARVGTSPLTRKLDVTDYARVQQDVFCESLTIEQCRLPSQSQRGKLDRFSLAVKSTFMRAAWPTEALDVIDAWIERAGANVGKIWMEALGGALAETAPDATAFPHRDAVFLAQYQSRWSTDAPDAVQAANIEWLRGFYDAMEPWNSGAAYVNYSDPDLTSWAQQYYGANYERLRAVKAQYDPHDVFHFRQSIPVA